MEKSRIFKLKSKFFVYRIIVYFSFLLIPIWITKIEGAGLAVQIPMLLLYVLFMAGQWFLLGKEIDYRLKIYFRVNSSIERVIYRVFLGKWVMLLYAICLSFLPYFIFKYFFWGTWIVLGLFYSWPTRGKIIHETMTSNFAEFNFLDYLEKTVVFLCIFLLIISIPKFPSLLNIEALKLILDPHEKISTFFWDFMSFVYFPFSKSPMIYKTAWNLHFYCIGMSTLSLTFYAMLRYFFSRRASILGVFAILSSWSYPKLLALNLHWVITGTFFITWIWAILWAVQAKSYRCGFFLGLLNFWGSILNPTYVFLMPIQIFLLYFVFFREQTTWFKNQVLKYMSFASLGAVLSVFAFDNRLDSFRWIEGITTKGLFFQIADAIDQKSFFIISIFGVLLVFCKFFSEFTNREWAFIQDWRIDTIKLREFSICVSIVLFFGFFIDRSLLYGFSILWLICIFSIVPVEWIFQWLSRLRAKRNFIYSIYILVCLLDSHIEERIKVLIRMLK